MGIRSAWSSVKLGVVSLVAVAGVATLAVGFVPAGAEEGVESLSPASTLVRGRNVPVRAEPLETSEILAELQGGDEVELDGDGVRVDGVVWWPVVALDTGDEGWVRWEFLVGVDPSSATELDLPQQAGDGEGRRVEKQVRVRRRDETPVATVEIFRPTETPTPEPFPTEEATEPIRSSLARSPASGTEGDPIPVGEYGRFEEWAVGVVAMVPDAGPLLKEQDPLNEARSGYQYVLFEMEETNASADEQPGGSIRYVAVAVSGAEYPTTSEALDPADNTCGILPEPLQTGSFASAETRQGQICFEVEKDDIAFLKIVASDPREEDLWFLR